MVRHPRKVKGFNGSLDELASAVGKLHCDKLSYFIGSLGENLQEQAGADVGRGRNQLAQKLYLAANTLTRAEEVMCSALEIYGTLKEKEGRVENVEGYCGELNELAGAVGNMAYDKTAQFVGSLAIEMRSQARFDVDAETSSFGQKLYLTGDILVDAERAIKSAWVTCRPHMEE